MKKMPFYKRQKIRRRNKKKIYKEDFFRKRKLD